MLPKRLIQFKFTLASENDCLTYSVMYVTSIYTLVSADNKVTFH